MAKWRAAAMEWLPEMRETIAEVPNVMSLWIELQGVFEDAYRAPQNDDLIRRLYAYADWCLAAERNDDAARDPATAVMVAFYEHIPVRKASRDDMPRWFRYAEVERSRSVFGYHLSEEQFESLLIHMKQNQSRYVPRQKPVSK